MQAAFTASLYDIRVSPQNLAAVPCYVSIIAVTRRKLNQQKLNFIIFFSGLYRFLKTNNT